MSPSEEKSLGIFQQHGLDEDSEQRSKTPDPLMLKEWDTLGFLYPSPHWQFAHKLEHNWRTDVLRRWGTSNYWYVSSSQNSAGHVGQASTCLSCGIFPLLQTWSLDQRLLYQANPNHHTGPRRGAAALSQLRLRSLTCASVRLRDRAGRLPHLLVNGLWSAASQCCWTPLCALHLGSKEGIIFSLVTRARLIDRHSLR